MSQRRDRKGSSQKNIHNMCIYRYSTAVNSIIPPYVYSECTVHLQNLLLLSFVGTEAEISHYAPFSSYARAHKRTVSR